LLLSYEFLPTPLFFIFFDLMELLLQLWSVSFPERLFFYLNGFFPLISAVFARSFN